MSRLSSPASVTRLLCRLRRPGLQRAAWPCPPRPLCGLGGLMAPTSMGGPTFTGRALPPSACSLKAGVRAHPLQAGAGPEAAPTSFLFPGAHFLSCAAHSISPPFSPCVLPSVSGPEQTLGPGCPPSEWWPDAAPAEAPKDGDLHRGYSLPIPRAASPGTRPLLVPSCPESRTGENAAVGQPYPLTSPASIWTGLV